MKKLIALVLIALQALSGLTAFAEGNTLNALIDAEPSTLDVARFLGIVDRKILQLRCRALDPHPGRHRGGGRRGIL